MIYFYIPQTRCRYIFMLFICNVCSRCKEDPDLLELALERATYYGGETNCATLRLLRPLYANTPSLERMIENAIRSDCPDTVSIVKMFYEDKNEEISEAAVEIARSRAVRRIVQMVDPGYEDDMEQRKADLKEKIMTGSAEATILGMYNCI